ncbi:ribonuclease HII [Rubrobacter taiwanensis]|uniref:Ribonuclease n=1 Tax=Rubrobacter taiwanensis TaxID=185139 RepID=A0A4R1BH89_9ACTN|nr:ribonuclease HII [Rubrobacter taiwanensis]TCJ16645.1 ribonuclease HII [Rubrobacter taiwanensis]
MGGPACLYAFDAAWSSGRGGPLCGADEAGRGAWAGPLVAAAVVLGEREIPLLNDSKRLSRERREEVFRGVLGRAAAVSAVLLPAWWVDRHGLGAANRTALERAISALRSHAGCFLADGRLRLGDGIVALPRADGESAAVAAASVVAKVLRDRAMRALGERYPGYGFGRHAGYGTPEHRRALCELGPCRVHRLSYAGVES